jgi:hypothetical protein
MVTKMFRYPSLIGENNTVTKKDIWGYGEKHVKLYPSEKMDGSNFSIRYSLEEDKFYTQSRNLVVDENWSGVKDVLGDDYPKLLEELKSIAKSFENPDTILFGEVYGHGVLGNRCEYKGGKQVMFYSLFTGIVFDPVYATPETPTIHSKAAGMMYYLAAYFDKLSTEYSTLLSYIHGQTDGYWFQTYDSFETAIQPYPDREGTVWHFTPVRIDTRKTEPIIAIKQRNKQFLEVTSSKVPRKIQTSQESHALSDYVKSMVTANRLHNIKSGMGEPLTNQTIGMYMKAMLQDIAKDFESEYPNVINEVPKDVYRRLLNVSKEVAALVKENLDV